MRASEFVIENADPKSKYRTGLCDVMAIALHRLTHLPLGVWAGVYYDDFMEEEALEYCHLCVVKSFENLIYIDVDGTHQGKPNNCRFDNHVTEIKLIPVSLEEAMSIFTSEVIDEFEIQRAIEFAKHLKIVN
jgi:hypothetical protein